MLAYNIENQEYGSNMWKWNVKLFIAENVIMLTMSNTCQPDLILPSTVFK